MKKIYIETDDPRNILELIGVRAIPVENSSFNLPGGITLTLSKHYTTAGLDATALDVFVFVMSLASSVSTGIAANWVYDKLKKKNVTLRDGHKKKINIAITQIKILIESDYKEE